MHSQCRTSIGFFARLTALPRPALRVVERRWLRQIGPYAQRAVQRGCEKIEDQIDFEVILVSKPIVSKLAYSIE